MVTDGGAGLRVPKSTLMFCGGAIVFALMACLAAVYGFNAVARCEVEVHGILDKDRSAMSKIALSNACGF